jgi:hypothetical protein
VIDGNPMTLRSQLGMATIAVAGVVVIVSLLRRRRISEGLFYLWLSVFAGILLVGLSRDVQVGLTHLLGTYAVISTMLLLALGFLFGASLVYSVLLHNMSVQVRDLTSYVAELRLDIDDLQKRLAQTAPASAAAPTPASVPPSEASKES